MTQQAGELPTPYVPEAHFEPKHAYANLKGRLGALRKAMRPQDAKRVDHAGMLNALAKSVGYANFAVVNGLLDRLAQSDVRQADSRLSVQTQETAMLRLLQILSLDMTDASHLSDGDWVFLERSLQKLAKALDLLPGNVCNAAAVAWCNAPTWSAVQSRIVLRRVPGEEALQRSAARTR